MTRRTDQIASTLSREIQAFLARGLADPRVKGLITVTGVDVSADLLTAKVRVTVMPEKDEGITMHGLRASAGHIQRSVAPRMRMKTMPRLSFDVDEGLKEQAKVMALLAKDRAERESGAGAWGDQATDEHGSGEPARGGENDA